MIYSKRSHAHQSPPVLWSEKGTVTVNEGSDREFRRAIEEVRGREESPIFVSPIFVDVYSESLIFVEFYRPRT